MIDGPVTFVIFRDQFDETSPSDGVPAAEKVLNVSYLRARERAERAAAKRATSLSARLLHQELAQRYMQLAGRRPEPADPI